MRTALAIIFCVLALSNAKTFEPKDEDSVAEIQDNSRELEEEEENSKPNRLDTVKQDIRQLESEVRDSDLSEEKVSAAMEALKHISTDAAKVAAGGPNSNRYKQALGLRVKSLKAILNENEENKLEEEDEEEEQTVVTRVKNGVRKMEEEIKSSDLPSSVVTAALDNLKRLSADVKAISSKDTDKATASRLKQAIDLRMKALRQMVTSPDHALEELAPSHKVASKSHKHELEAEERVLEDVDGLKSEIRNSNLTPSAKKQAEKNVLAIKEDAKKFVSASSLKKKNLAKAMKLRVSALKRQLSEARPAVAEESD